MEQSFDSIPNQPQSSKKRINPAIIAGAAVALLVIGGLIWAMLDSRKQLAQAQQTAAEQELTIEQLQLSNEYDELSASFQQHEGQMVLFNNDSIRAEYEAAKNKVEELREELKHRDQLSQKRIKELQNEINTLRNIMRHYVEQINELQQQNQELRETNETLTSQNKELSSQVEATTTANRQLSQRMELAEKLNVTGVSLRALKSNGKQEKNVTKAKQLAVSFTIPQNNSTPVGRKTIYLRITSPEGNLLQGNGISFKFEGATLQATAQLNIDYEGNELAGLTIYWDNNATLNPGSYKVELFADNYRLASRDFTLTK
jgi:myosin heavy subunit